MGPSQARLALRLCICLPLCASHCQSIPPPPSPHTAFLVPGRLPQRRRCDHPLAASASFSPQLSALSPGRGAFARAAEWVRRERGVRGAGSALRMSGGGAGKGEGKRVKVVVISGPTAVGKSALAERLALSLPQGGEIISADSVQVYRGMDIGSNKPTAEERASVPYHLIDVCDPEQEYTAADFADQARLAILDVDSRGKLPIVVGGTGFYLQWLVYGRPQAPAPTPEATLKADAEADSFGGDWDRAFARAHQVDPVYCETLKANDWFRLKRCLEVFYTSGRPVSSYERPVGKKMSYSQVASALGTAQFDFRCFFLYRPRLDLFRDIDLRCEIMLQRGFLREVKKLVDEGALRPGPSDGPASEGGERAAERSIGYRQALDLVWQLRGGGGQVEGGADEAVRMFIEGFQAASRQFVKRQLTWFSEGVIMRETLLPEDEFRALYSDEQEQESNRQSEANKQAQQALKRYVATRSIYDTPDARKALLDEVMGVGTSCD